MRAIKPLQQPTHVDVYVPGSKSYTHRMLIAAALSDGASTIQDALDSEDTTLTLTALSKWGVAVERSGSAVAVTGRGGELAACREAIFLGNSGTSMRLLTAVATLARGKTILTGGARMQARPIQHLLDGLTQLGVAARSTAGNGCPPVEVLGGAVNGGRTRLNCSVSSQFLSALLLIAPCTRQGIEITVTQGPVSRPYVDITLDSLARFGVESERRGYEWFHVAGGQRYRAGVYAVEPDCSQASYFWAAAAVTGSTVTVKGITADSRQGDIRLLEVLSQMGCRVAKTTAGVAVSGADLSAVDVDMGDMPDVVPTLAVVAAFARGKTLMHNVSHLREKESDRLAVVSSELNRIGIDAGCDANTLWVQGGSPRGAAVETHNDHRIAMSFAVAGLKTPGIVIMDETCVQKSFPTFWKTFDCLYG
jgi:3-phosphoshikimate 1-carboxyvinyltransferase